ncbi:MAG: right-handed parallel beta-helix repeat-containing protein [Bryobacteraceae bacterium]
MPELMQNRTRLTLGLFVFAVGVYALFAQAERRESDPIHIYGQRYITLKGLRISNPTGTCIEIGNGASNIRIEDSEIGPCRGHGIRVSGSRQITIAGVQIHDTTENGVDIYDSHYVDVLHSTFARNRGGIYALDSRSIEVRGNRFSNARGPSPRGQFVQFDKVNGPQNRINCNYGKNTPGQSNPEDAINLHDSNGEATDPIQVIGNRIEGGGPSNSGGGILLGDSGGSYQVAKHNVLVDPGQYGVAVAGGHHMAVTDNHVYARAQSFTNVGIYVWNQYSPRCYGITVQGNVVNWTNKHGQKNSYWNGGNCGTVGGWLQNQWNAPIGREIIHQFNVCTEQAEVNLPEPKSR